MAKPSKKVSADQMNRIRRVITDHMGMKIGHPIDSEDTIRHSLKINGMDLGEILMDLEEEFEIEIPGGVSSGWRTVRDIETYIANHEPMDSAPRVAQPKKVVVKMAKEIGEPVKFQNSRPHNLSLIMGDLEKKLAPTKATAGFVMQIHSDGAIHLCNVPNATTFARAVVEISEGFNGFRLYVGEMLVIDHNVGSESHILALCDMARLSGAAMPKSLDEWLVSVIVRYVACVKQSLRYMQHLYNGKDTTQQLFSLQRAFELKITDRVFDLYESENVVAHAQSDVLRVFREMIESVHPCRRSCYNVCSSFRDPDDLEEEEEEIDGETIDAEDEDEIVDLLADVSTPGLVALFNHIVNEGKCDFDASAVHELSGMKRRIEIIDELAGRFGFTELVKFAQHTDLNPSDFAIITSGI
jgi:acyl carrier protein